MNFTWLHDSCSYFPCPSPIYPHPLPHNPAGMHFHWFHMCHQSGPISILLIVTLGLLFTFYLPNHVLIIPYVRIAVFLLCFHPHGSFSACE